MEHQKYMQYIHTAPNLLLYRMWKMCNSIKFLRKKSRQVDFSDLAMSLQFGQLLHLQLYVVFKTEWTLYKSQIKFMIFLP